MVLFKPTNNTTNSRLLLLWPIHVALIKGDNEDFVRFPLKNVYNVDRRHIKINRIWLKTE